MGKVEGKDTNSYDKKKNKDKKKRSKIQGLVGQKL